MSSTRIASLVKADVRAANKNRPRTTFLNGQIFYNANEKFSEVKMAQVKNVVCVESSKAPAGKP